MSSGKQFYKELIIALSLELEHLAKMKTQISNLKLGIEIDGRIYQHKRISELIIQIHKENK